MSALIALAIFSLGARKTMRRLWNGIDRQLYQKAFKKQGKRVERVCVEWARTTTTTLPPAC